MRWTVFLLALAVPAGLAAQDAVAEIARCSAITSSLERLDCYDRFAAVIGAAAAADSTAPRLVDASLAAPAPITIALASKGLREIQYQDYITITLLISNQLSRSIRAVNGVLTFMDLFDQEIMATDLTIEERVEAGGFAEWDGTLRYNQFLADHSRLASIAAEDVRIRFDLAAVVYTDGTRETFEPRR